MENAPALDECARELQRFANFSRKQGVGLSLFNCSKGVLETPSLPGSAGEKAWSPLSRNESETGIHTIFEPLLVTAR